MYPPFRYLGVVATTLFFLIGTSAVHAQIVNDLERASDSDQSKGCDTRSSDTAPASESDTGSDYSSYDDDDDNGSGGGSDDGSTATCGGVIVGIFSGFGKMQNDMLDRSGEVNRITSLEAEMQGGIGMGGYFSISPSVHANWGILSTGFRYFNLTEPGLEGMPDSWATYDFEILRLNYIQGRSIHYYMGTGITVQEYQGRVFHEFFGGLDLFLLRDKVAFNNQARISTDYCGCDAPQRMEYNSSLYFRVAQLDFMDVSAGYQFVYQNYYKEVQLWTAGAGLKFLIH